jgi:hypothetical protein
VNLDTAVRLTVVSLLLMFAACALAEPATVTLPAEPPAQRTVELEEQWRIGGEDEEEVLLGVVFDAMAGTHGDLFLIDRQLSQVLQYSSEGELMTTLGRQGDGPGELNLPHGMLLLEDGQIGVIQGFPGKVIILNADGTPGGEIHIGGSAEEGGFNFVRELARSGDHLLGARGRATFDQESGKSATTNTLAIMDMEGKDQVVVVEHSQESDMQRQVFDEAADFSEMDQWTVGDDGLLYTVPVRDEYTINVRNMEGELVRVLTREFRARKRTQDDKDELVSGMIIIMDGVRLEIENKALDNDPAIMGMNVARDGRLYVRNCYDQEILMKVGQAGRFDIISPAGEFVEQLTVAVPGFDGKKDRLVFLDGTTYVVIRNFDQAQQAMMAGFGDDGEEDDSLDDAEPLEVVVYRVP